MPYKLQVTEDEIARKESYPNSSGKTECVEFVRQTTNAPHTTSWRPGIKVMDAAAGTITRGTAIATFDTRQRYPTDTRGRHAAIFLSQTSQGILVLDQWNDKGRVTARTIRPNPKAQSRSNDANTYYVIE
jgi:hypothetical protein